MIFGSYCDGKICIHVKKEKKRKQHLKAHLKSEHVSRSKSIIYLPDEKVDGMETHSIPVSS